MRDHSDASNLVEARYWSDCGPARGAYPLQNSNEVRASFYTGFVFRGGWPHQQTGRHWWPTPSDIESSVSSVLGVIPVPRTPS